ncbi:hypothetical protein LKL35_04355 [Streptomyces sp. ET3-23]|uniref:hypothetical protein n=1 Tax=Streptomyces sp. ET3-23 TaxID=2885643 RepID=UPI001D12C73E|nr:hypothetical protein [Streptomyces sp. ET3-23]MCC2274674.1 hypothetical protein [Streptomyces sp. ET3-23]
MTVSRRGLLRSAAAVVPAVVLGSVLPGTARAAGGAGAVQPQWQLFPCPETYGTLGFNGLDFAPDGTGWAVGDHTTWGGFFEGSETEPAAWRWDGTQWTRFAASAFGDCETLRSVSVGGRDDAWAVGSATDLTPRLLHWDGKAWTNRTAGLRSAVQPARVSGSGSGVWLVGTRGGGDFGPVVLRWNGAQWSEVALPADVAGNVSLSTVKAVAPDNVWVAGDIADGTGSASVRKPLVLHWDGGGWTRLPSPAGAAAGAVQDVLVKDDDVWAAGYAGGVPLAARWDGRAWTATSPAVVKGAGITGLASYGAEVRATGYQLPPLQRWDGRAWSTATPPFAYVSGTAVLATGPDGSLWMAGRGGKSGTDSDNYTIARLPAGA